MGCWDGLVYGFQRLRSNRERHRARQTNRACHLTSVTFYSISSHFIRIEHFHPATHFSPRTHKLSTRFINFHPHATHFHRPTHIFIHFPPTTYFHSARVGYFSRPGWIFPDSDGFLLDANRFRTKSGQTFARPRSVGPRFAKMKRRISNF